MLPYPSPIIPGPGKKRKGEHPLSGLSFIPKLHRAKTSRARPRAKVAEHTDELTNRALAALRQCWKGVCDDSILASSGGEWPQEKGTPNGDRLRDMIRWVVGRAYKRRPSDCPTGAAAALRQQGAGPPVPGLATSRDNRQAAKATRSPTSGTSGQPSSTT